MAHSRRGRGLGGAFAPQRLPGDLGNLQGNGQQGRGTDFFNRLEGQERTRGRVAEKSFLLNRGTANELEFAEQSQGERFSFLRRIAELLDPRNNRTSSARSGGRRKAVGSSPAAI